MSISPLEKEFSEAELQATYMEAASALDPVCKAERRDSSKILELFEKAINEENLLQDIQNNIIETVHVRHKKLTQEDRETIVRGLVFENIALASLEKRERPYPELENVLLTLLQDPNILIRTWYGTRYATSEGIMEARRRDPKEWFDESYNLKDCERFDNLDEKEKGRMRLFFRELSERDMWHSLKNNDALSVTMENDKHGQPIAWVTGLREAKTYMLNNSGNEKAIKQAEDAPENLRRLVKQMKTVFSTYKNLWNMEDQLPQNIDSRDKLDYEVVQPADVEAEYVKSPIQGALAPTEKNQYLKYVRKVSYEYVDITRKEINALTKVLVQHFEWE